MGPSLKTLIRAAFDRVNEMLTFHKEIDFMPEKGHIVASVKGVNSFGETLYKEEMLGTVTYTETMSGFFVPVGVYEVVRSSAVLARINNESPVEIDRAFINVISERYAAADVLIVAALTCALHEAGLIMRKVNTTAQLQPGIASMWPAKAYSLLDKPLGTDFNAATADMLGYTKEAISHVITSPDSNMFIRSVNNGEFIYVTGANAVMSTLVNLKIENGEEDLSEVTWKTLGYTTGNLSVAIGRSAVIVDGELHVPVSGKMYCVGRADSQPSQGGFQQTAPMQAYQNGFPMMYPQPVNQAMAHRGFNGDINPGLVTGTLPATYAQALINQEHHYNRQGAISMVANPVDMVAGVAKSLDNLDAVQTGWGGVSGASLEPTNHKHVSVINTGAETTSVSSDTASDTNL